MKIIMNNMVIKSILFFLSASFYTYSATIYVEPGAAPQKIGVTTNINLVDYFEGTNTRSSGTAPLGNIISFRYNGVGAGSIPYCSVATPWTCIDGYCGIPVSSSVQDIIYIPSGNVYSDFYPTIAASNPVSGSVSFNVGVIPTLTASTQSDTGSSCFSQAANPNSAYINDSKRINFNANLDWYIYAAKSTTLESANSPFIHFNVLFGWLAGSGAFGAAIPANTIVVTDPLTCSVSAPSLIDFGTVNTTGISGNNLIESSNKGLSITCNSNNPGAMSNNLTISFTSSNLFGQNALGLKNINAELMGYIRGVYLDNTPSCVADTQNQIIFDGSPTKTINNIGVGQTLVPITWSLCKNSMGKNFYGDASASATVVISWD
ncbi:hypothetical protein GKR59_01265 [Providencia alcalifaciens]|uniref:hypothetical protein n=1 Tax=Providencia TaxID=586 RepID=UPI0012B65C65|nr:MULTISPECIES: hypothetical protein [Providencia]MTC48285.1 hypothetical protein [Providencia alcalifaciens]